MLFRLFRGRAVENSSAKKLTSVVYSSCKKVRPEETFRAFLFPTCSFPYLTKFPARVEIKKERPSDARMKFPRVDRLRLRAHKENAPGSRVF